MASYGRKKARSRRARSRELNTIDNAIPTRQLNLTSRAAPCTSLIRMSFAGWHQAMGAGAAYRAAYLRQTEAGSIANGLAPGKIIPSGSTRLREHDLRLTPQKEQAEDAYDRQDIPHVRSPQLRCGPCLRPLMTRPAQSKRDRHHVSGRSHSYATSMRRGIANSGDVAVWRITLRCACKSRS